MELGSGQYLAVLWLLDVVEVVVDGDLADAADAVDSVRFGEVLNKKSVTIYSFSYRA
jgi:hypothetical protein